MKNGKGRIWVEQTGKTVSEKVSVVGRAGVISRRQLPHYEERNGRGQVVVLSKIVADWKNSHDEKEFAEWIVEKGDPDSKEYTVIGKYLYRNKDEEKIVFNLSLLIPEDMEIEKVPGHEGGNLPHFRIQFGDILVFIYSEEPPKPGDYINGLAEIEVGESKRPNMGPKTRLYPAISLFVGYGGDLPKFSVEINSTKRNMVPKGSFGTSPTHGGMFIHIDPIPILGLL